MFLYFLPHFVFNDASPLSSLSFTLFSLVLSLQYAIYLPRETWQICYLKCCVHFSVCLSLSLTLFPVSVKPYFGHSCFFNRINFLFFSQEKICNNCSLLLQVLKYQIKEIRTSACRGNCGKLRKTFRKFVLLF